MLFQILRDSSLLPISTQIRHSFRWSSKSLMRFITYFDTSPFLRDSSHISISFRFFAIRHFFLYPFINVDNSKKRREKKEEKENKWENNPIKLCAPAVSFERYLHLGSWREKSHESVNMCHARGICETSIQPLLLSMFEATLVMVTRGKVHGIAGDRETDGTSSPGAFCYTSSSILLRGICCFCATAFST